MRTSLDLRLNGRVHLYLTVVDNCLVHISCFDALIDPGLEGGWLQ